MVGINSWMISNWLRLTADKRQFIILSTCQQLTKINCNLICLNGIDNSLSTQVTCLGVIFDSERKFDIPKPLSCRQCFYLLRQLRSVRGALTVTSVRSLVHAFIVCRIDHCNSVLNGVSAVYLQRLQSVMNAAARLIVQKRKFDPITATICDIVHWLPVTHDLIQAVPAGLQV